MYRICRGQSIGERFSSALHILTLPIRIILVIILVINQLNAQILVL